MKAHLGCGHKRFQGWINIDLYCPADIRLDLSKGKLPFYDEEIDFIFSEHFIEHITLDQGIALFKECFRVLKRGGIMRISTPDLYMVCNDYVNKKIDRWVPDHVPKTRCQMVNESLHKWGHQFIYDFEELQDCLVSAGFSNIIRRDWGVGGVPDLDSLETQTFHEDLIVEATKI